jgi:hypothetical protein
MWINGKNGESATVEPIVLREGETMRLVFKPTLVHNHQNDTQPVLGEFVYQKKRQNDEWEDDVQKAINQMSAGCGIKLALKTGEIDAVLRHVQSLYSFYREHQLPNRRQAYQPADSVTPLTGTTHDLLANVAAQAGEGGLSAVLKWAMTANDASETVKQLTRLDASSLQQINSLSGISALKQMLSLWDDEQNNGSEEFWQKELTKRPYIFSQVFATPVVFVGSKAFVGGKGIENSGGKYTDFVFKAASTSNLLFIEIKEPTTKLLTGSPYRDPDVYGPSRELSGAVVQVARYKDRALKDFYSLARNSYTEFKAASPRCLVVAGHSNEFGPKEHPIQEQRRATEQKMESFELFRNNLRECSVITFDELFGKTRSLVEILESSQADTPPF